VRQDVREMDVSDEMTSDRGQWEKRHATPTLNELGQGQEEVFNEMLISCTHLMLVVLLFFNLY
jgi:hypothetical protein